MIETTEEKYYGLWFLPNSNTKIQGYLVVTENVIDLNLTDPENRKFENNTSNETDELQYVVIHGLGEQGEKITLYDCVGFSDTLTAKFMLSGNQHYDSFENQKFKIIGVHVPLFDNWIGNDSFEKNSTATGFVIEYREPQAICIVLDDEVDLRIDFECFSPRANNRNKINLHQFSLVNFIVKEPTGMVLSSLFKYVLQFQQLVSFLLEDGANVSTVRVYSDDKEFLNNRFLGAMLYGGVPFNKFEYQSERRRYLISKADMGDNLSVFIQNWFGFSAKGQHILKLIFLDYFYRGAFDENNFLNLIRALEVYHIYKYPGKRLPDNDFKKWLSAVIEGVPETYRTEVKEHLAYKNELTLDERLTRLFSEVEGKKIGFEYIYDEDFKRKLKHSRNYYTHYNPNIKNKAVFGEKLESLTIACRALINYLLLKHMGIPESELKKCFEYYFVSSYYSRYFL